MSRWLTIPQAARRVARSQDAIYAWIRAGHLRKFVFVVGGRLVSMVIEKELLEADRLMRSRRGRPKKNR